MTLGTRRISQKRSEISPVPAKAVTPPPENEDNKSGLTCRMRLFLKNRYFGADGSSLGSL